MLSALGAHVRLLVRQTSRASRLHLVFGIVLALAGRLGIVATAYEVSRGEMFHATVVGVAVTVVIFLQRALAASARILVERDLHRSAMRAILESDVFVPFDDVHRAVFDTLYRARTLLVDSVPVLVADVIALGAIVPILLGAFPMRVLAIAGVGLGVVLGTVVALRGIIRRMEQRVLDAYQGVVDRMLFMIEARLEIVANARESRCTNDVDAALDRYTTLGQRNAFSGALLGRAPLLAGAVAVGLLTFLDSASRDALTVAVLGQAVLLAACAPPIIGAALATHELVRSRVLVGPLLKLLQAEPRGELARRGSPRPKLPSLVHADALSFAYAPGTRRILDKLSFEWGPGKPLVLVGPNGSGKSTLLRLILALRTPSAGGVEVGGIDLQRADVIAMRGDVAYLPQRPYLGEPHATVREALGYAFANADDQLMLRKLDESGLLPTLRNKDKDPLTLLIGELSAGQRQRVALARVLLPDASMILLDEPDANLDREGVTRVSEIVRARLNEGKLVAIAAHTPDLAALPGLVIELATGELEK